MQKKIAVVGGGIFGCTTAIVLARAGFSVTLFEKEADIMQAASGINQYRMHKGYHYPRSSETILSSRDTTPEFEKEYGDAIISSLTHYYCIAKEKSFLTGKEYLTILDDHDLPYQVVHPTHINHDSVDVVIQAEENLYDPNALKEILKQRLDQHAVQLYFNRDVDVADLDAFDFVTVATYAESNSVFKKMPEVQREYQFEVCEKIVVEIPPEMKNMSIVVMDGPFTCFDPLGNTGYAVMGHVEHAIHHRVIGHTPVVPEEIKSYLNKGIIQNPKGSNAKDFITAASHFMPFLEGVKPCRFNVYHQNGTS